jgi:hypothetical protein
VGPLLCRTEDGPYYHPGLLVDLVCWFVLVVLTLITATYFTRLNAKHAAARRAVGKTELVADDSLEDARTAAERRQARVGDSERANERAFDDLTDLQNEDFMYAL